MDIFELIIISLGLAMDAFAVSICKGVSIKKISIKVMMIVGFYFGLFQALMPLIGYFLGVSIISKIESIDHYIILILLFIVGIMMIKDAFKEDDVDDSLDFKNMILLSLATSIDAMSVGITFSFLNVSIIYSCLIIGILTFILSFVGVKIGSVFGKKYRSSACIIGGIVLILIGIKIFMEHMGIINF